MVPLKVEVPVPDTLVVFTLEDATVPPSWLKAVAEHVTAVVVLLSKTRARQLTVVPSVFSVGKVQVTPKSCALSS